MNISEPKLWARALSVATIATAGILLSGCSLISQLDDVTGGDPTAENTEDDVFSLKVGDCFNDETDADTVSTVDIVSCDTEHDWEAYASILMDDAEYPGDTETQTMADEACLPEFESYVGIPYDSSTLDYSFYYPTADTWEQISDREILCLLYDPEGKTTGSLKDAAI